MNVLISCAGRQAGLVRMFQAALDGRGEVIATDADPLSAAFCLADRSFVAPPIAHETYLDWVVELCRANDVGLALSLFEADTRRLESVRRTLEQAGCRLIGAPPEIIDQTEDKVRTRDLADDIGVAYPGTWTLREVLEGAALPAGPFVVKQRGGRGSRGLAMAGSREEVTTLAQQSSEADNWIAQVRLVGEEFGLDVVNDLRSRYRGSYQRRKLRLESGEAQVAVSASEEVLLELAPRIAERTNHQGCLNVDLMLVDGAPTLLEVNARFGGDYAFSHAAGANLPALLVAWAIGEPIQEAWLHSRPGVTSLRTSSVLPLAAAPGSWKPGA
ncbi:MAG: ATP-grasp domain-containing protein [Nitriliruptor sp.]|nr:MAG: ATP-grasp domain-containing protein [Nitriliruptor sp.]